MKDKYDGAIRDKVVNQLEKDRALAELNSIKKNELLYRTTMGILQTITLNNF